MTPLGDWPTRVIRMGDWRTPKPPLDDDERERRERDEEFEALRDDYEAEAERARMKEVDS